jgi:hypothetical protein
MVSIGNHQIYPYTYVEEYNLVPTSANADRQLARAPWPLGMYFELLAVRITSQADVSGGQVVMWDQDLSNTTPTTRGSAGGSQVAIFGTNATSTGASGVSATTIAFGGPSGGPTPRFYGGIALQATRLNTHISAEVRIMR